MFICFDVENNRKGILRQKQYTESQYVPGASGVWVIHGLRLRLDSISSSATKNTRLGAEGVNIG